MKLSYRDRIILLVVLVVVILGIGIFVFVKPKWEKLSKNEEALKSAQEAWDKQKKEFEGINTIRENINKKYDQALEISENFTDEMNSVELDEFLQEKFMNNETFIKNDVTLLAGLTVTDESTTSMGYYYYTPSTVTYPLFEYADLDGSLAKAMKEKRQESDIIAARTTQSVGYGSSQFTMRIDREDTMTLIDAVRKYATENKDAMMLKNVSIVDYYFNGEPLERDEDGNIIGEAPAPEAGAAAGAEAVDPALLGYTEVTFDYEVYYMQEPMKPNVGEPYDAAIWDGDKWETYKKE